MQGNLVTSKNKDWSVILDLGEGRHATDILLMRHLGADNRDTFIVKTVNTGTRWVNKKPLTPQGWEGEKDTGHILRPGLNQLVAKLQTEADGQAKGLGADLRLGTLVEVNADPLLSKKQQWVKNLQVLVPCREHPLTVALLLCVNFMGLNKALPLAQILWLQP